MCDKNHIKIVSLQKQMMSSSADRSELAESSGTQEHPPTVQRSLARSGRHGKLAAKKKPSPWKQGPRASTMQENRGTRVQRNGSRCSGMIS